MSPNRDETLFALALEQPAAERAAFLKGACLGDDALRVRVEELLAAHDATLNPLATQAETTRPTRKLDPSELPDEAVGQTLGRYKLLERIGEGGCGVVYVAEQTEPVRRRVALKVIKLGMDTKSVVARFEAERQALAMMDHPNIAKVLDAGTVGEGNIADLPVGETTAAESDGKAGWKTGVTGRPYFVMELVRGIRITDYCDQAHLSTRERLNLFIKVCHAIQHAHQKGIIHRDIKPSNILVTLHDGPAAAGCPKVIDFGIAKATEGRLTDHTVYTQLHQFIGTPAYMSPEQAEMSGLDIDTRSDIYSLGVLLYELLAGSTPFDGKELMASGIDAMRKTIREKEPVRPSTRLTQRYGVPPLGGQVSARSSAPTEVDAQPPKGGTPYRELVRQIEGDLDWIVMKCLEKDRQRRYDTANGLAADLNRHLDNEPVLARPPSPAYMFQKAWRRNRVVFTAATAVAVALLLGAAVSTWQAVRATRATKAESAHRLSAEAAKIEAQAKQREAEVERSRADAHARKALESQERSRRLLYASDMNLAQQALKQRNLGRASELLDRHHPAPDEKDLRGWEWRHFWLQCQGDSPTVLAKPSGAPCSSLSFSADGARLAVGYLDGRAELWDTVHRVLLKELSSKTGLPGRVAFSPRSDLLAATIGSGALRLLDLPRGREINVWGGTNIVRSLSFTRDGSRLLAYVRLQGGPETAVTIDVDDGLTMRTNAASGGDAAYLGICRLSSGKKRLFTSRGDRPGRPMGLRCLDPETGREIWDAPIVSDSGISAMALSPDEKVLVTGTGFSDGTIRVWDTETGKPLSKLEGLTSWTKDVAFSHDGRWLVSANDQTIRFWETSGWTEAKVLNGHRENVRSIAFSPDDRMLASGGKDGAILLWDLAAKNSDRSHQRLPPEINLGAEVAPGILAADRIQDMKPLLLRLEDLSQAPVAFDVDPHIPAQFIPPNMFGVYDRTNLLEIYEFRNSALLPKTALKVGANLAAVRRNSDSIFALAVHPAQRLVAWGKVTNEVHIAALDESGHQIQWASGFARPVPLEFSPDGKLLAIGQPIPERGLEVREVTTGRLVVRRDFGPMPQGVFFTGRLTDARFVDEGRRLVAASTGDEGVTVLFWDLAQPERDPVGFFEPGVLRTLDVSPDGRWVATGNNSGSVTLYNAATLERSPNILRGRTAVHGLAFSPDGRTLATGYSGLEAVKLWHVETGQELLTFPGDSAPMDHIVFADGGNTLLAGSIGRPGSWQLWRAPSWEVIHAAEAKKKTENKQP